MSLPCVSLQTGARGISLGGDPLVDYPLVGDPLVDEPSVLEEETT
jgi:hypothetical protein